jgi:thiol-disulfide isomerase/thioredoxin
MIYSSIKRRLKAPILLNMVIFIGLMTLLFNPLAKAALIKGLMKVGLFQPKLPEAVKVNSATTSAPDIVFQGTNGRLLHLADQRGKVVFINFWATWCGPCIAEMPAINRLYEKLKGNKNIVFIIVDADHDFSKSRPFMAKRHFTMPLYQAASKIPESFLSNAIPTTTIIDRTGKVVFHQEGSADYSNPKVLEYLNKISK